MKTLLLLLCLPLSACTGFQLTPEERAAISSIAFRAIDNATKPSNTK